MLVSQVPILLHAPSGAKSMIVFDELWPTNAAAPQSTPPNNWLRLGSCDSNQLNIGGTGWLQNNTVAGAVIRDCGGSEGVLEIPYNLANSQGVQSSGAWPYVILRSDSTFTNNYTYIIFRQDTQHIQYIEHAGSDNIIATGTTTMTAGLSYGIRCTCRGNTVKVELDSGSGYSTELNINAAVGLTQTYFGIGNAVANNTIICGEWKVGP